MYATTASDTLCKRAIIIRGRALGASCSFVIFRGEQVTSNTGIMLLTLPLEDGGDQLAFDPIGLQEERAENGLQGTICE